MKKLLALMFLLLVLSGCAEHYWIKNGASSQEFEMDKAQCNAQALSVPNITIPMLALIQNQCLRGKGWNLETRYKQPFSNN
jgi:hypothetical protein